MAFVPEYTESDLSASIVDTIVKVILVVGTFITIIVLVLIWKFLKKNMK